MARFRHHPQRRRQWRHPQSRRQRHHLQSRRQWHHPQSRRAYRLMNRYANVACYHFVTAANSQHWLACACTTRSALKSGNKGKTSQLTNVACRSAVSRMLRQRPSISQMCHPTQIKILHHRRISRSPKPVPSLTKSF